MTRPLRVQYEGALYHIIARGNEKQQVFIDDSDHIKFLSWLQDTIKTHNLICHGYCLMDNHFHILLETPDANISTAMRDLNGNYSQSFNVRHNRVGHVFQGRYKSFIIEKEPYLLEVVRYIVLNPVRASMVKDTGDWKWSSYRATAGLCIAPDWLKTDWILANFSNEKTLAQKAYRKFVKAGMSSRDPYEDLEHDFILGTPQFIHWIWDNQTAGSETLKNYPREQRIVGRPKLEEIFLEGMSKKERDAAIAFAKIRCGYFATEIARFVKLDPAVVGRISKGTYNTRYPSDHRDEKSR